MKTTVRHHVDLTARDAVGTAVPSPRGARDDLTVERDEPRRAGAQDLLWATTRVALGFVFLWAFLDKTFGLGHATPSARAWIHGGSPTTGFLSGVAGPFQGLFSSLAGHGAVDWLFMLGLLGIGLGLTLGVAARITAASATAMLVMMWMASLPITTNPFLDDHLVYALVIVALAVSGAANRFSLAGRWQAIPVVRRHPVLR